MRRRPLVLVAALAVTLAACDGGEAAPAPEPTALPAPEPGEDTVTFAPADGSFSIELPAGWAAEELGGQVVATPAGADSPRLTVVVGPTQGGDLDDVLGELTADVADELETSDATVEGASEARRLVQPFDDGGRTILAATDASGDRAFVADLLWLGSDDFSDTEADGVLSTLVLRDPETTDV